MMVVPVACAMQFGTGYRLTLILAVAFNVLFMITGLSAAYYLGLKPGGTIVLVGVIFQDVIPQAVAVGGAVESTSGDDGACPGIPGFRPHDGYQKCRHAAFRF